MGFRPDTYPSKNAYPICPLAEDPDRPCTLPIDAIIESRDGERFGAHSDNIDRFSGAFPYPTKKEGVSLKLCVLKDRAWELRMLLKFMHRRAQPDIRELSIHALRDLANAAERYEVYSALQVCKLTMELRMKEYPMAVLGYALRHDYRDLADQACLLTWSKDISDADDWIDDHVHFRAWVLWHRRYNHIRQQVLDIDIGAPEGCTGMEDFRGAMLKIFQENMLNGPDLLQRWKEYRLTCPCASAGRDWRRQHKSCIQLSRDWLHGVAQVKEDLSRRPVSLREFVRDVDP